jgi:hypothetical protein
MQIEADITRIENELLCISDSEDLTIRTALYRNLIVLRLLNCQGWPTMPGMGVFSVLIFVMIKLFKHSTYCS